MLSRRQTKQVRDHASRESVKQAEQREARLAQERSARQERRRRDEERKVSAEEERARERARRSAAGGKAAKTERGRQWACKILGVSPDASPAQIKKAYIAAMKTYHPDQVGNLGEEVLTTFSERAKQINVAYDMLRVTKK